MLDQLANWLIGYTDVLTNWLTDWLTDHWLTHWVGDVLTDNIVSKNFTHSKIDE